MRRFSLRHILGVLLALGLTLTAIAASAQTTFNWPNVAIDVSRYASYEECYVAVGRVADSVARASTSRQDTLPPSQEELEERNASRVVETAARCSARFDAGTADLHNFYILAKVYIKAGRTTSVDSLLARRLAAVRDNKERAYVLDTIVHMYLQTNPVDYTLVDRYFSQLKPLGGSMEPADWVRSLSIQLSKLRMSYQDARARQVAQLMIDFEKTVSESRKQLGEDYGMNITFAVYVAHVYLKRTELVESLKVSTSQFVALHRKLWAEASGARGNALVIPIGETAKPITGDFWFSPQPSTIQTGAAASAQQTAGGGANSTLVKQHLTRPSRGKNGLVIFLGTECSTNRDDTEPKVPRLKRPAYCPDVYRIIRHFSARFPQLELTVVAQTHGFFSRMDPPSPDVEAEFLRKWWLGYHKVPAVLSVTNTAFWRLPGFDKRRINEANPNRMNYSFGIGQEVEIGWGFLIDRDGIVIEAGEINRHAESQLAELIEVLEQRPQSNH